MHVGSSQKIVLFWGETATRDFPHGGTVRVDIIWVNGLIILTTGDATYRLSKCCDSVDVPPSAMVTIEHASITTDMPRPIGPASLQLVLDRRP